MLELASVRAGYGRTEILHGVALRVPTGSTVALLGANGAGKTTLLRTVAGLLPTTAGQILLDGVRIERWSTHQRARAGISLVPEGRGIFRQLTVRDNIVMQADGSDVDAAIDHVAARFPVLARRLAQQAGTLSGGEQQMLALARALVSGAQVVMADELSVGLAPVVVDQIFEAVRGLREEGRSLLVVEQYVDRALDLADYVYILHKGRVAFVGEPAQCRAPDFFEQYLGVVA